MELTLSHSFDEVLKDSDKGFNLVIKSLKGFTEFGDGFPGEERESFPRLTDKFL